MSIVTIIDIYSLNIKKATSCFFFACLTFRKREYRVSSALYLASAKAR